MKICSILLATHIMFSKMVSFRDRSTEFLETIKLVESRSIESVSDQKKRTLVTENWHLFVLESRDISKQMYATSSRVERLTILARNKSLFDDNSTCIQGLMSTIKKNVDELTRRTTDLEWVAKGDGQAGQHAQLVMDSLQFRLTTIVKGFKQALERRTISMKQQKTRRDEYTNECGDGFATSILSNHGESSTPVCLQVLQDKTDDIVQDRVQTMHQIESTIVEVGAIMQALSGMVREQKEMVQRIDANVEETHMNVEASHMELLRYFRNVTSNRWLAVKTIGVLLVFFMLFVSLPF